jgi:hypothetical protein
MIDHIPGSVYKIVIIGGFSLVFLFFFHKSSLTERGSIFFTTEEEDELSFNSAYTFENWHYFHSVLSDTKYLVASSKCKIPDLEPLDPQVRKFYHPEKYTPCSKLELLTYVTKIDNIATLHIDTEIVPSYTKNSISCCYANITRQETKSNPDDGIK